MRLRDLTAEQAADEAVGLVTARIARLRRAAGGEGVAAVPVGEASPLWQEVRAVAAYALEGGAWPPDEAQARVRAVAELLGETCWDGWDSFHPSRRWGPCRASEPQTVPGVVLAAAWARAQLAADERPQPRELAALASCQGSYIGLAAPKVLQNVRFWLRDRGVRGFP